MPRLRAAATAALFAATTAAAQTGTYRPGQPYAAMPTTDAAACERTCGGDAGCRSWNHVTLASGGVCELNSADAIPIASPNATSGPAPGRIHDATSRVVRVPGGSTLRLGSPEPAQAAAPVLSRRVIRPVPLRPVPTPASVAARPVRPAFRHNLDNSPLAVALPHPVPQPLPPARQRPVAFHTPAAAPPASPVSRPPTPRPPTPRPPVPQPQLAGPPTPTRPVTQESLFGSLYDDVSAPAPADPDALADPDAPVATATSLPVNGPR